MNDTPAGFGRYVGRIALMLAILVVLVAAGWTWLTLSWAYSVGEGELAQYVVGGVAPQIWYFSVRDAAVADQTFKVVGQNVQVRYREHRGIPTNCFGDTPYFAESFTIVPPATR